MAKNTQSYINTMVFAIIAGFVSIALLFVLLYSPSVGQYAYTIVTIEIGLLAIIIHALVKTMSYDRQVRKIMQAGSHNALLAGSCPDYYTIGYDSVGTPVCKNFFQGTTPDGNRFLMYFVPSSSLAVDSQGKTVFKGNPADSQISLRTFEKKRVNAACKIVQGRDPASGTPDSAPTLANNFTVPWTDLRPKCDAFSA